MVNLLVVTNLLLLISTLIAIVDLGIQLWPIYFPSQAQYEWFAFSHPFPISIAVFYKISLAVCVILLLLFFKSLRQSWLFSIISLLLINWLVIYLGVTELFRDYQPSSWYVTYEDFWSRRIIYIVVFVVSLIVTYSILYSMNKLPFASVLFKNKRKGADVQ